MHRQRFAAFAALFALVIAAVPGLAPSVLAARDPAARFKEVSLGDGFKPAILPFGANPSQRVTVFVQMQGDSVADARANAADNKISEADKGAIERDLKSKQDSLRPEIQKRGGNVRGQYQAAVNGMKVEIDRGRISEIEALPGVTAVLPVQRYKLDNTVSVPYIGAPAVWAGASGLHGEGIKIGIIDTGIDYTHANFGGPGTVAAWTAAKAASTSTPNPGLIGPGAAKVKGGIDFVGDDYNADPTSATYQPIPHPDQNPLDCNGHGSHVAGTAAGFGVKTDGHTYTGSYNATTPSLSFTVGPGVAPKADLYAIRVFGCQGSTDVVVDAIDWAVSHDLDVINMSLGSDFGAANTADALASDKATKAGVIVVAASGNAGSAPYITSSPASADGAISVAAVDSTPTFRGLHIAFGNGTGVDALNANLSTVTDGTHYDHVKVLTGAQALGCSVADFGALAANTLAIVTRGSCARVAKAIFGQQAGAAAVAMINNAPGYPPLEGPITSNPDDGTAYIVTIPFLGIRMEDGAVASATTTATATLTNVSITNPAFRAVASFSSAGPRLDNVLKPEIGAPGVSILSTAMGTGSGGERISGTSMATPHVAGAAALTRQAHPTWRVSDIKAAIVNTGDPGKVAGYMTNLAGSGLVQPVGSTRTQTVATTDRRGTSLSFGYQELNKPFTGSQSITLKNRGSEAARFNVSVANASGSPHTTSLSRTTLLVPAGGDASVDVRLAVPAATAGDSTAFNQVAGLVTFTPATASDNGGATLRVPYYLVPRALSDLSTTLDGALNATRNLSTTATIRNRGVIAGNADFYAWGLSDKRKDKLGAVDLRAAGVQAFPTSTNSLIVFAINTWNRWSNASTNEFDVLIDVNGDGVDDFDVIGFDLGYITTGSFSGQMGSFTLNLRTGALNPNIFLADAPMNSATILLATRASRLQDPTRPATLGGPIGLSPTANPRFSYHVASFDLLSPAQDATGGRAKYNAWTSSISQGDFQTVNPGAAASSPVMIDATEWAKTPALGLLIATSDNRSGSSQAQLISVPAKGGEDQDNNQGNSQGN